MCIPFDEYTNTASSGLIFPLQINARSTHVTFQSGGFLHSKSGNRNQINLSKRQAKIVTVLN
jgi:hypothetical protein